MRTLLTCVISKENADETSYYEYTFKQALHSVSKVRIVGYTYDGVGGTAPEHVMIRFHNFTNGNRTLIFKRPPAPGTPSVETRMDSRVPLFMFGGPETHVAKGPLVYEAKTPHDYLLFERVAFELEKLETTVNSGNYVPFTDFTQFVITLELTSE